MNFIMLSCYYSCMTTSRTIDNLPNSDHVRYIEEQVEFDPMFVHESFVGDLAAAPEITHGYKPILDIIFGTSEANKPFAHFTPPPVMKARHRKRRKRKLFSRRGIIAELDGENLPENLEEFDFGEGSERCKEQIEAFLKDLRYVDAMVLEAYGKIDRLQLG